MRNTYNSTITFRRGREGQRWPANLRKYDDDAILKWISEQPYCPSYREISDKFNIGSTSVVQHILNRMEAEGKIERRPGRARSIRVISKESSLDRLDIGVIVRALEGLTKEDPWIEVQGENYRVCLYCGQAAMQKMNAMHAPSCSYKEAKDLLREYYSDGRPN
jgi:SOS-response transcriptional repressor LexA